MKTYLKDLRWGRFNLIEGDMISTIATHYGEWSEVEVSVFQILLSASDNVVEVGSNIGMHAVPLAKMVQQGKLICFEPQRIIFQQLCCNLALNNLTNVDSYRLGVGDQDTTLEIESSDYNKAWNYGSFSLDKGFSTEGKFDGQIQKEGITVISLDTFPAIKELNSLALLKIDAEGFDIKVLKGAQKTIQRLQPAIFVEAHQDNSKVLFVHLKALNYRIFSVASERYQEKNFFQAKRFEQGYDCNFLALPTKLVDDMSSSQSKLFDLLSILTEITSLEECTKDVPLLTLI